MSNVTVGFVPRDRFCRAAECLERLFAYSNLAFDLIVVNCNIPEVYWNGIQEILNGRTNVRVLEVDRNISSNQARNLVLRETRSEFLCIIENDVWVHENWLSALVAACEDEPAEVAVPLLLEPHLSSDKVHFDPRLGHIEKIDQNGSIKLRILPGGSPIEADRTGQRRHTELVEMHCVMFRTRVFDKIGPFDEAISGSRAEVDLSLALYNSQIPRVLEPKSQVTFLQPPAVYPEEREYYLKYWNVDQSIRDHEHIKKKWNLVSCPTAIEFARARFHLADELDPKAQLSRDAERMRQEDQYIAEVQLAMREVATVIPYSETIILVDESIWTFYGVSENHRVVPFTEKDGDYWGPPENDRAAIDELERLRRSGATFIVIGWPAFWWLDCYKTFNSYLRSGFRCILENSRIIAFDLKSS